MYDYYGAGPQLNLPVMETELSHRRFQAEVSPAVNRIRSYLTENVEFPEIWSSEGVTVKTTFFWNVTL